MRPVSGLRALQVYCGLFLAFAFVFRAFPALDLATSRFFLDIEGRFPGMAGGLWWVADNLLTMLSVGLVLAALVLWPLTQWCGRPALGLSAKFWAFVVLLYFFGPGVLVNGLLKQMSGRARPISVEGFGGDGEFTLAWSFSNQCAANCSFVSAHAAAATTLALSLVLACWVQKSERMAGPWTFLAAVSLVLLPLVVVQRIGSGQHFLSDTVFAALIVLGVGLVLLWQMGRQSDARSVPATLGVSGGGR